MAIKDILLPLVGEPDAAVNAAIEKCVGGGRRYRRPDYRDRGRGGHSGPAKSDDLVRS